jgi:hypothetical protein
MRFSCERCGKRYTTNDTLQPDRTYRIRCKACGNLIEVKAGGAARPATGTSPAHGAGVAGPSEPAAPTPAPAAASAPPEARSEAKYIELFDENEDWEALPTPPPAPAAPPAAEAPPAPTPLPAPAHPAAPAPAEFVADQESPPAPASGASYPARILDDPFADLRHELGQDLAGGAPPAAVAPAAPEPPPPRPARPPRGARPSPRTSPPPAAPRRRSPAPLFAAGALVVLAVAGLAVWRPWSAPEPAAPRAADRAPPPAAQAVRTPTPTPTPAPTPTATPTPTPPPPPTAAPAPAPPSAHPERSVAAGDAQSKETPPRTPAPAAAPPAKGPAASPPHRAEKRPAPRPERKVAQVEQRREAPAPQAAPAPTPAAAEPPARPAPAPEGPVLDELPPQEIQRVLAGARSAFDGCLRDPSRGLDQPLGERRVTLRFNIEPEGTVSYPTLDDVTISGAPVGQCLKDAARRLRFPAFAGDPVKVDHPIAIPAR